MGLTAVYISHDLALVRYLCERTVVMYLGTMVEDGPTAEIVRSPRHPYTRALVAAVPVPDADQAARAAADQRQRARRARAALGLPLPRPLPACLRPVRDGDARAAAHAGRAQRGVSFGDRVIRLLLTHVMLHVTTDRTSGLEND